ncbi:class I SAM-dependent methyltransferase [Isoptericola cucumis]|uniref:Methyltransferase domain-containing protein n=1 Tax=Isoptericola cucumis TaxID=1776856 RepID=A0ABQ2BBG0_9MICO|nr:methyltransferase domain-containing protein [Isoptericola cucumis]GGI11658.1 hypothetical protein GCM10007368_37290 [Isoptericola cucumis]
MRLVIGPTSAGKSTFVERMRDSASGGDLRLHFAYEIKDRSAIPTGVDDVVHFNLLHSAQDRPADAGRATVSPMVARLIDAADEVVVLAAPRPVLLRRASQRSGDEPVEAGRAGRPYNADRWARALEGRRLAQVYEHLALHLDHSTTPVRYLCSNGDVHDDFATLSRWDYPRLAGADSEQLCREGHPTQVLEVRQGSYQADYREGAAGSARSTTLELALQMPLAGKRVLDIGCAEGAAALSAHRMGAKVTAIEPWGRRFEEACTIAKTLDASIDLRNVALEDLRSRSGAFDVVLALNVIHHSRDPLAFLDRAADLTSSHLVLEYPGLADRKFRSTLDGAGELPEDQPLIGLSTRRKDQTFVFSPASLERYLLDTVRAFGHHQLIPSPIPNRWLSVFSKKRKGAPQGAMNEISRLRRAVAARDATIAQLEDDLHDLRTSRSWRLTEPLRQARARLTRPS